MSWKYNREIYYTYIYKAYASTVLKKQLCSEMHWHQDRIKSTDKLVLTMQQEGIVDKVIKVLLVFHHTYNQF